jgi:uncharacterized damage-inducible protein DinB
MQTNILLHQYQLVLGARSALFTYCEQLKTEELQVPVPEFNNRSINYLLVHVANTYLFWLCIVGQQKQPHYYTEADITGLESAKQMFAQIDITVNDFLLLYKDKIEVPTQYNMPEQRINASFTPLQLFTHVTTHEFHHKGQILIMSRLLGYIPADTDVIRP